MTAILVLGCTKQYVPTMEEQIAEFLSTRSTAPLEGTIWEHVTGEDYNRYIVFDGNAKLFYGLVEDGELQRWSDFYEAPYELIGGVVVTSIEYPVWGFKEVTGRVQVIKAEDAFIINVNGDQYHYYGNNLDEIEGQWMIITVNITPWSPAIGMNRA